MSSDRNLLFGMLALHAGLVTREQLLDAMSVWMSRKDASLGDILRERGALDDEQSGMLDGLVNLQINKHGDAQKSLAALRIDPLARWDLEQFGDADVQASVASLGLSPETSTGESVAAQLVYTPRPWEANAWQRYRVLRPHARGGLGEVFVARDEELGREVALKQIQERFADDADSRRRFIREAEITGNLEHPGIVPVYGLLSHPDGRPYYAMRFIHGESLLDAIQRFHQAEKRPRRDPTERSLALRGLLGRFVTMCNAVAYAHSRGVIHRDLKPANVMLGEYGETLVVDWGLARASGQREFAQATTNLSGGEGPAELTTPHHPVHLAGESTPTQQGQVLGTIAFMPPEQARGEQERMGPTSDVFALGATLYALLTGQAPFANPGALEKATRCRFVPPRQIRPAVPRALEAVCLKAMAAKPEARYAKACELAEEVEHWLADEPVQAYRDPVVERLRRWGRRNRSVVTAGMAVLIAGVVGLSVGLWAVNREKAKTVEALQTAELNLKLAKDAVDKCFNIAKTNPLFQLPRMEVARKLLLETTLPFFQEFRARRPDDPGLQLDEAIQWSNVAYIEHALGRPELARVALQQARTDLQALVQAEGEVPEYQEELGKTHNSLGAIQQVLGQRQEARKEYEQALAIQSQLVQEHPSSAEYRNQLASTRTNLGQLLVELGQSKEALLELETARSLRRALVQANPQSEAYRQDLGKSHHNLGTVLHMVGREKEAVQGFEQARKLRSELVQARPHMPAYQHELAITHNNLGLLLRALGQNHEALKEYQQARIYQSQLVQVHPDLPDYQQMLSATHNNLGNLLQELGRLEEAKKEYLQARALRSQLTQAQPQVPEYQQLLAGAHHNLGAVLEVLGQREDACKEYEEAKRILRRLVREHPKVPEYLQVLAKAHNNLGLVHGDLGHADEARKEYQASIQILRQLVQDFRPVPEYLQDLARSHHNLGVLLNRLGQPQNALTEYRHSRTILRQLVQTHPTVPDYRQELGQSHNSQGMVLAALRQPDEARKEYQLAKGLLRELVQAHPGVPRYSYALAVTHNNLGMLQQNTKQVSEAVEEYRHARELLRPLVKSQPKVQDYQSALGGTLVNLSTLERQLGQHEEAVGSATEAVGILQGIHQSQPQQPVYRLFLRNAHLARAQALVRLERHREALPDWNRASELSSAADQAQLRPYRAYSLAQVGEYQLAAAEAEVLGRTWLISPPMLYNLACIHALNAGNVARDPLRPLPERHKLAETWSRQAVTLLQRAANAGFLRIPANRVHLDKDDDLALLRTRPDYAAFVATLPATKAPVSPKP